MIIRRPMNLAAFSALLCFLGLLSLSRADGNEQSIAQKLRSAKGQVYYNLVSQTNIVVSYLRSPVLPEDVTDFALRRILNARRRCPEVFEEMWPILQWAREWPVRENVDCWYRIGYIAGTLRMFCRTGPDSRNAQPTAFDRNGAPVPPSAKAEYSDMEIFNGQTRNQAARMAVLELFMKGMNLLNGREQAEIVLYIDDAWSLGNDALTFPVHAMLAEVSRSDEYSAIARLFAMKHRDDKNLLHDIYSRLLLDSESPYNDFYYGYVQEAVKFLKENHPEELEKVETDLPWKKEIIDKALGRPVTPWRRDEADQESANEVEVIF